MLPVIRQSDLPQPSAAFQSDRIGKDDRGFPCLKAGCALTASERSSLEAARRSIDAWLAPATPEQVATFVSSLRVDRRERDHGEAIEDARASLYLEGLGDMPGSALAAALSAIIRDGFPELSPVFMPTATELRRVVSGIAEKARAERRWIDHILALPVAAPEASAEERESVAAKFDAAAKQLRVGAHERRLGDMALEALRDANAAAARAARAERVADGLSGRRFPPPPSQLGASDVQLPADSEPGEDVA
jgi:hypothetical protein